MDFFANQLSADALVRSGGRGVVADSSSRVVSDLLRFDIGLHDWEVKPLTVEPHCLQIEENQIHPTRIEPSATNLEVVADPGNMVGTDTRPTKRVRSHYQESNALHRACCNPNVTVDDLAQILLQDPTSISRKLVISTTRPVYNPGIGEVEQRMLAEPYKYPLNLAIEHSASFDVVEMLMTSDPSVLLENDGVQGECSLLILLKRSPRSCVMLDLLLLQDPRCVMVIDRHQNTALHVACFYGASEEVLRHLCILQRHALWMRNFHGDTPLMVAQNRISVCSDAIVQFLWKMMEA